MIFSVPDYATAAISMLAGAGFHAYPVGGCVRDTLMGGSPHDWDLCTDALPEQMLKVFRNERTADTGLKHGTVTLILDGKPIEITTFRADGAYTDSRHPDSVTFTSSLREDLARRDFTVNAMAYDPVAGEVVDPFGGKKDLKNGILRAVGVPENRFREDALRILRGVRFSARLGFRIEDETFSAMERLCGQLKLISIERVFQELCGLLSAKDPEPVLLGCKNIIFEVIPELKPEDGCLQNSIYHDRDVWRHTAHCVASAENTLTLRWAALLHDIGKPCCRETDAEGQDHFRGHQEAGAKITKQIMERLKAPNALADSVYTLVRHHDITLSEEIIWPLLSKLGSEAFDGLLKLKYADLKAHAEWVRPRADGLVVFSAIKEQIIGDHLPLSVKDMELKGEDIAALGAKGKEIGHVLKNVFSRVTVRECGCTRDELLKAAHQELADLRLSANQKQTD